MSEQASRLLAVRERHTSDLVAAALVGAAGALHVRLMPEHFQESIVFGLVFLGIALFQLGIASALVLRATPLVRSIGRWGSLAIVVAFLGTRIVPPPGGNGLPERIEGPEGLLSVLLELGALAALTVILPMRPRAKVGFPYRTAIAIGAVLLGIAVGLTIQLSRARTDCSTRVGLLAAMPASLSAPVCCGPSLLSAAGVGLPALLGPIAVPLLGLSGALLLVDIGWLRRQLHSAERDAHPDEDHQAATVSLWRSGRGTVGDKGGPGQGRAGENEQGQTF